MAAELLIQDVAGSSLSEIVWGVSGYNPADVGTEMNEGGALTTGATITLTGITDGQARQSLKFDLGAVRAEEYAVFAAFELQATPTTGATISLYWAPSPIVTQGSGNIAGNSGADADAVDGPVPAGITVDEFVRQCQHIGTFICSNDVAIQTAYVGRFPPADRFGQLIVYNNSGATFVADNVEHHVTFRPIVRESQ